MNGDSFYSYCVDVNNWAQWTQVVDVKTSSALTEPGVIDAGGKAAWLINTYAPGIHMNGAGDDAAGMKAILAANPEHGEPLYHFKLKEMKARGMVDGGDAARLGIGAMTDARWKDFFQTMSAAGLYPATLDYKTAYSLEFLRK